jgi:hypothetical protein
MGYLVELFGRDFAQIFGTEFNDPASLHHAMHISEALRSIEGCEGIQRHLAVYRGDRDDASFCTLFAAFVKPTVDQVLLEPLSKTSSGEVSPDLLVSKDGTRVYFECKNPALKDRSFDLALHQRYFEIFCKKISHPHQLDVTFRRTLDDNDISLLADSLEAMLRKITQGGVLISNENLEVIATPRVPGHGPTVAIIEGVSETQSTKDRVPGHVFIGGQRTYAFFGPAIDTVEKLKRVIGIARKQAPTDGCYVPVIRSNFLMGRREDSLRAVRTRFQPDQNSRISGVLLAEYSFSIEEQKLVWVFDYVPNPYAASPPPVSLTKRFN